MSVPIAGLGILIVAGGAGSRFGDSNKLHAMLAGRPVFSYAVNTLAPLCDPAALILVVSERDRDGFEQLARQHCPDVSCRIVCGGATRGQSVLNGLKALPPDVIYVAIHDAARPFASSELLSCCLDDARRYGGAIVARPVTDTIKRGIAGDMVGETVDRSSLWAVETPQVFELSRLRQAYQLAGELEFTDDAGVMEAAGFSVKFTLNTACNLKITYCHDLAVASAMLQAGLAGVVNDH